jgi:hypothetical protein
VPRAAEQPPRRAVRDHLVDQLGVRPRPRLLGEAGAKLVLGARQRLDEPERAASEALTNRVRPRVRRRWIALGYEPSSAAATRS